MTAAVEFFVSGQPKGQPRPRAFARKMGGKFVARVYDAGTAEGWKGQVALMAQEHRPIEPWVGPVAVRLTFLMPRPKSHLRTGKLAGQLRPDAPVYHTSKPDADNLAKAVLDCITQLGAWWKDDGQVAVLAVQKFYAGPGKVPGCWICVSPLNNTNPHQQQQAA